MNRADKEAVKSVINEVAVSLNLEKGLFRNERTRDGTVAALRHADGWFIKVTGGRYRRSDYHPPKLGVSVAGMVYNDESKLVEYLTLHGLHDETVRYDACLEDRKAVVEHIIARMAPVIAENGVALQTRWARESAARQATKELRERYGITSRDHTVRIDIPDRHVTLRVADHQTNPDHIKVGLDLHSLTPQEADAILALLRASRMH